MSTKKERRATASFWVRIVLRSALECPVGSELLYCQFWYASMLKVACARYMVWPAASMARACERASVREGWRTWMKPEPVWVRAEQ